MANAFALCLILSLFCCTNLSWAREQPKECSKGPEYWCQNLKQGAACGAVQHCISTVWSKQNDAVSSNVVSDQFTRLFRQLKDVKDMINTEYLATRVRRACRDVRYPAASRICKDNTEQLHDHLIHVLVSETTPETMCTIVGMCNNGKVDDIIASHKKKAPEPVKRRDQLVGSSHCTWGPSYWCSNFTTVKECKATHHCVQRVWPKMEVAEDTDSICKICTDMVQQARDQLQSNETQEELKEVFEGSCKLIPIKLVAKECMKLADDFVPELVETLASQMNPQQVCSVAGLCNNAKIDRMLEDYNVQLKMRSGCTNCQRTVGVLRKRYDVASYEDFLVGLLSMCGRLDSLSDSCSMLVFKYFENIRAMMNKDFTSQGVCHLSGQCAYKFHMHDEFTFPEVEFAALSATDDVPCEFCEQLVTHLRDMLVANTTELEFEKVLKGLCQQTGEFKSECLQLVDQYYTVLYKYLTDDLKPGPLCTMIGMCGKPADVPIAPLLPSELALKVITPPTKLIGAEESKIANLPSPTKQANVRIVDDHSNVPPLPIERMFIAPPQPQGKAVCSFCQYFMHYLQVELSDTNNEEIVKAAVEKACDKLPQSINGECKSFVTEYGPAVIALLVQEIDPSSVCPALGLCPQTQEVRRVAINSDKSNCPLCLFAVEQLDTMIKNNRTEETIRKALDGLCNHLSQKLRTECVDFVDTYSSELIKLLANNVDPTEICTLLKLCTNDVAESVPHPSPAIDKYHDKPALRGDRNNHRGHSLLPKHMLEGAGDIETNEIPDNTVNGRPIQHKVTEKPMCVLCEFVMKELDDEITDKHNEDEIKKIVHNVCKRMPKSVRSNCDQFVDKYADLVISLLAQDLEPAAVCAELKLCDAPTRIEAAKVEILDCAVCETVVLAVQKVLSNDKIDRNVLHIVEKSCSLLPAKFYARCHTMMEIYGDSVIHLIEEYGTKGVCQKIGICNERDTAFVRMHKTKN